MVEDTQKRYADDVTLQELVRLRVENERLREALRYYADRQNYIEITNSNVFMPVLRLDDTLQLDDGHTARVALKECE